MKPSIPIYRPDIDKQTKALVNECLDSSWISSKGKFVGEFEAKFSEFTGSRHSVAVSNGTVALHLALLALGVGPGDEVIVPTLTYISPVNAITYTGARPVFVDSLATTWQMDPCDVKKKINSRTRAIIAVHLYGHPCEMSKLVALAKDNNLFLVEDCAEAFGSYYEGQHVGTFGDIATYSFFSNKTITTGEGGMVVTDDETLFDRSQHFKGQGLAKHREYWHDVVGYNYRMTNICAAIGVAQLERAKEFLDKKKVIAGWYREGLKGLPLTAHAEASAATHSYWMCSVLVDKPEVREPLRQHLAAAGIETRPFFYPIHTMPMYSSKYQKHPVAEDLGWRGINLPSWPGLTKDDVLFICSEHQRFFDGCADA